MTQFASNFNVLKKIHDDFENVFLCKPDPKPD